MRVVSAFPATAQARSNVLEARVEELKAAHGEANDTRGGAMFLRQMRRSLAEELEIEARSRRDQGEMRRSLAEEIAEEIERDRVRSSEMRRSLAEELRSSGRAEMDALVLIVQATIRELEWEVEGLAEEAVTLRNAAAATRGLMESAVLPLDKPKEEEAVQEGAESEQEAGSEEEAEALAGIDFEPEAAMYGQMELGAVTTAGVEEVGAANL